MPELRRRGPRGFIFQVCRKFAGNRKIRWAQFRSLAPLALNAFLFVLIATQLFPAGCGKNNIPQNEKVASAPTGALELLFPYGSEKEKWITEVTDEFNRRRVKTSRGKPIFVKAMPMGSGESIENILSGQLQAHIASPASAAFIKLGNAESRATTGKELIGAADN